MRYETICKDFKYGGLKNVGWKSKMISSQCSQTLIKNTFVECFFFHSKVEFNVSLNFYPEFYINIFYSWKHTSAFLSLTPSWLRSQFLLFHKDIKINNKPFHFQDLLRESINIVEHLCKPFGAFKNWSEIKTEY